MRGDAVWLGAESNNVVNFAQLFENSSIRSLYEPENHGKTWERLFNCRSVANAISLMG